MTAIGPPNPGILALRFPDLRRKISPLPPWSGTAWLRLTHGTVILRISNSLVVDNN